MDKKSKSKLIQELLPSIVELLSNAIDQLDTTKAGVSSKKRGRPKTTKTVKTTKLAKTGRLDFDHKTPGFIDNLTLETELIETDKKVCKKTPFEANRPKIVESKCECGQKFEGNGYLCDKCIMGKKSSAE